MLLTHPDPTRRSKPAKLHLYGSAPVGDLARPFKNAPGMLEAFTGQTGQVQTDAASIKSAEKPKGVKKDL